jgi:hypothetical protein
MQQKLLKVENQSEIDWLGGWLYPQPTRVQTPSLTLCCLIKTEYSFNGRRRFHWQRRVYDDFVNFKTWSAVFRRCSYGYDARVCVHRGECMRVYVNACVCTVFLKKRVRNVCCYIIISFITWYMSCMTSCCTLKVDVTSYIPIYAWFIMLIDSLLPLHGLSRLNTRLAITRVAYFNIYRFSLHIFFSFVSTFKAYY